MIRHDRAPLQHAVWFGYLALCRIELGQVEKAAEAAMKAAHWARVALGVR